MPLNLFNVANRDEYRAYSRRSAAEVEAHGGRVVALGAFLNCASTACNPAIRRVTRLSCASVSPTSSPVSFCTCLVTGLDLSLDNLGTAKDLSKVDYTQMHAAMPSSSRRATPHERWQPNAASYSLRFRRCDATLKE